MLPAIFSKRGHDLGIGQKLLIGFMQDRYPPVPGFSRPMCGGESSSHSGTSCPMCGVGLRPTATAGSSPGIMPPHHANHH